MVINLKCEQSDDLAEGCQIATKLGWARSASGETAEGILSIEEGIREVWTTGTLLGLPYFLALKAEALHLADRTSEALAAIQEAEALVERSGQGDMSVELHRLRGVFLAAMDADETQIEASLCAAIETAKKQKSISLAALCSIPLSKKEILKLDGRNP